MMTNMKKYILLSLTAVMFAACNDWLDVTPKDKVLEEDLFSSEDGINNATNGLYGELTNESLYGGQLTQTTVDLMGHFYTYSPTEPGSGSLFRKNYLLANFQFTSNDKVKSTLYGIWKTAYSTLLHINTYIKNVNKSPAVMSEKNKSILLGESYGMRAYLHFDLFRLFGPAWQNRTGAKILPYNDKAEITLNHTGYEETEYCTADEFMTLLLKDIATAEELLKTNDPVIGDGGSITDKLLTDHFYQNRNRRMNYYAVKGLEARVRQYRGEYNLAAEAAKVITDQTGNDKRFKWVDPGSMMRQNNYIFFSEVIFGLDNMEMFSHSTKWYMGTELWITYAVDRNNLITNILGYEGSALEAMSDIRSKQWSPTNVISYIGGFSTSGTYRSNKYLKFTFPNDGTDIPAIKDLQVLMRISEMYYIQAEAALKAGDKAKAVELLNTVLEHRGLTVQNFMTIDKSDQELQAHIEREYYREFFGEGQVFFFHKRLGSTKMFKGYDAGTDPVPDPATAFVAPVPDDEKNI
jgi:hypothetical protein